MRSGIVYLLGLLISTRPSRTGAAWTATGATTTEGLGATTAITVISKRLEHDISERLGSGKAFELDRGMVVGRIGSIKRSEEEQMANIRIAVINASTVLTDDQVQAAVPALQTQVHRDFAPIWGIDADVSFVPSGSNPNPGLWWLTVLDDSDQAGALGYHDITDQGLPLGKGFAGTDLKYSKQWTVTASHELLEMLADPEINLTVFVPQSQQAGTMHR